MSFYNDFGFRWGGLLALVARDQTIERLRKTCFRFGALLAGNFSRWNSVRSLFMDAFVREEFLGHLDQLTSCGEFGTHSVEITCPFVVGWASTAPRYLYAAEDTERFEPNRRSSALRVKPRRTDLLAPKTHKLTFVFELKDEGDKWVAVIHSIYPGEDIGNLVGDVTEREGVVFFDFGHPGA